MSIKPWPHQRNAVNELRNGNILVGGTGTGKSLVGLVYYIEKILHGSIEPLHIPNVGVDLYIITTPKKRDDFDWQNLAASFGISSHDNVGIPGINVIVDSWNNIKKYEGVVNAFFIFDEQRTVGSGVWAKTFVKIAKKNSWIMLSATPADLWTDLISVFVANGFYRNRTEFIREHVVYSPHTTFPKIDRYVNVKKLELLKSKIYVYMDYQKPAKAVVMMVKVEYDEEAIKKLKKTEWNPYKDGPIINLSEYISVYKRLVYTHKSRIDKILSIFGLVEKIIVFYNFNYELAILKSAFSGVCEVAEYNGHRHDSVPKGERWVYLVQYMSGNEAWECFSTNHMVFFSLHYSYRITVQAMGRISRLTTEYDHLYYYKIYTDSYIDRMILLAHKHKKKFNERSFSKYMSPRVSQRL